jgi:hypothetical protein
MTGERSYFVGLDLGQSQDFTALAILERTRIHDQDEGHSFSHRFAVRHLQRWPLGTPYTRIVADVLDLARRPPLPGSWLAVDATGVGRPVVELFHKADLGLQLLPITITAGQQATAGVGGWSVPKKDLVGVMLALSQSRRFHIVPSLPDAATLGQELQQFRVKVTAAGNETFEAWRERDHDDLVLAVALAAWLGERHVPWEPPSWGDPVPTRILGEPHPDRGETARRLFGRRGY